MDQIRTFLESWGLWTLLLLFLGKWISGILVAVKLGEFKWYYLHEALKTDGVALVSYALLLGIGRYSGIPEFNSDYVKTGVGAALSAGFIAGIFKNLAHILPSFADSLPNSLIEPAELRLGNEDNIL